MTKPTTNNYLRYTWFSLPILPCWTCTCKNHFHFVPTTSCNQTWTSAVNGVRMPGADAWNLTWILFPNEILWLQRISGPPRVTQLQVAALMPWLFWVEYLATWIYQLMPQLVSFQSAKCCATKFDLRSNSIQRNVQAIQQLPMVLLSSISRFRQIGFVSGNGSR